MLLLPLACACFSGGLPAACQSDGPAALEAPMRLTADGRPIDVLLGQAAPALVDWDGDGDLDLLVGQAGEGMLGIHANVGTRRQPRFEAGVWFRAGGHPAKVPAGSSVGFGPAARDLDGDGRLDVLTGCDWPGDVWWFRGRADGGFAEATAPRDEAGRPLNAGLPWRSPDVPRAESLSSSLAVVDLDRDGDFDVLVGNAEGTVVFIENVGGPRTPRFSIGRRKVVSDGATLRVPGGAAAPAVADWDGDGRRDLVVGAGDGSVRWYPNVGRDDAPRYAAGRSLVPAATAEPLAHGATPTRSGRCAKPCVVDFDGDGRVDLLVGDQVLERGRELELDPAELARRDELLALQATLNAEAHALFRDATEPDEAATRTLTERLERLYVELAALEPRPTSHGFVWLYRRSAVD